MNITVRKSLVSVLGYVAALTLAAAASGQALLRPVTELAVEIEDLPALHVTTSGKIIKDDLKDLRDGCDHVETYSSGPFDGGGTLILQGGFAEGEAAACTYTVPADAFPIKINVMEMVFGTSGATMQTTTKWAIFVFDGLPDTGTIVAQFESDDIILPHIVLPPGNNGVNVQVTVDPGDPEQIIINNDSGTNIFTVAFQIVEHNQQTQDPCVFPPPSCCNAFPAVDADGLSSTVNNWLYAIDCGSLGAPEGWSRFSSLGVFRPSGDWIMRTTWQSVDCQPGVGACCYPNGDCLVSLVDDCQNAGGTYMGDGTQSCPGTPCDQSDCPGDLNGDGQVGQTDLGILLAWYELGDGGDINGDGETNQIDLGILLAFYDMDCN